ncbi:unnamed protein product, partial [Mesorhabditis spiculigera]
MAGKKCVEMLSNLYKGYGQTKSFMKTAGAMRVISADQGKVKIEFDVSDEMTNAFGTLHATNTALRTLGRDDGVSVDLHVSFLGSANVGETIVMDVEVLKAGQSMAFSRADLYVKETGKKVATGNHTKSLSKNKL